MAFSTDITLPSSYTPKFPAKCLVCHGLPDSTLKIAQNAQNPFVAFLLPILLCFGWSRLEIPVCRACQPRFRLQRWGRELGCWILVFAAIWLMMPHFRDWSRFARKLAVCGLALLALSPYILAEVWWPRIFNTTARKDSIDYEFASPAYAAEFLALNRAHVLKHEVPGQR